MLTTRTSVGGGAGVGPPAALAFIGVEVTARWEGAYRCRVSVRQFELLVDEPPAHAGGTDTGPQPTELLLASMASCFALAVAHAAGKRRITLPDLAVTATGEYDGLRFATIRVEVRSTHPPAELAELVERAKQFCYVSNTLRGHPALEYVVAESSSHQPPPSPG
jgi:putative redox protein